jgi:hypothetical protein
MTATETPPKKGIEFLGNGIHMSTLTGGVYETTRKETEPGAEVFQKTSSEPWVRWGTDDNYPQRLIDVVKSDPIATLIGKKIAFLFGRGLMFYKKEVVKDGPGKGTEKIIIVPDEEVPQEVKDFFRINDFKRFMYGVLTDFVWWCSVPVQYVDTQGGKIVGIKWQRRKNVRPEWRNETTGEIENYYLSGFFGNGANINLNVARIPAFKKFGNGSGLYIHDLPSVDKDYSPDADWHGITRWLNIASKIPRWILANIDNSLNFKYHVKIPLDYILKRVPEEAYKTRAEWEKAIQEFETALYKKIDDYLAGEKNVHKAFYSKVAVDDAGKPLPGWEIIPIENSIQHEAWLKAYGTAAMAMISGIGLAPSIAGSILPNGLGSGSGSDLREQFNFFMQVMTSIPREICLEPWEIIKFRNGWPEWLHLGFRDVVLQSTDQNKSGFTKQNEDAPTTDAGDNNKTQP